jgi:kynurenine formamidase
VILDRLVDLSHPVHTGTPVYPGDPEVVVSPAATVAAEGYNVLHVSMGSQSGTHVDAPFHFLDAGARIDAMDLTMFLGPAVVADVRHVGARQPIRWADLAPVAGQLVAGRILLLHTGWSAAWGTDAYFDHPYLDAEAATALVVAGIRTIGVDAASIDETIEAAEHPTGFAAHHVLLGAGCAVVENLRNLAAIDFPDPFVSVLPLRLADADGAPVRAVAFRCSTPDGSGHG